MRRPRSSVLAVLFTVMCGPWAAAAAPPSTESIVRERTFQGRTVQSERDEQQSLFNYYFRDRDLQYQTRLAELKRESSVPKWRIPYSAAIHPESGGGLSDSAPASRRGLFGGRQTRGGGSSVLSKYDRAFNAGQDLANSYESRRLVTETPALLPWRRVRNTSEHWEGYCSGFTASTIKHPEPVKAVDAAKVGGVAGVVFQPSDIKALLSAIYNRTTNDSYLHLAPASARGGGPNMATFHLTLGNYIGQAGHPVATDRTKGQVSWNNPIYSYRVESITDAGSRDKVQYKNVTTKIWYTFYGSDNSRQTNLDTGERTGHRNQSMRLRYVLALNEGGDIIGGRALSSSGHFLWVPLYAVQAKRDGSAPGNPHLDVRKVLALARESALPEVQKRYDRANIGPAIDPTLTEDGAEENPVSVEE